MDSKTLRKLKADLITELPFFPNNKITKEELEAKDLGDILIYYLHWKNRIIPARRRAVQIKPDVTADKRWKELKSGINGLLNKIRSGEDVTPHLSNRVHSYGYTPIENIKNGSTESWEDKDELLNLTGFHHLHLDMEIQSNGRAKRSDEVLFAHITRKTFTAIGIFDHSVFEKPAPNEVIESERERLWSLHHKYASEGKPAGAAYLVGNVVSSGLPLTFVRAADMYYSVIQQVDARLGERSFANELYTQGGVSPPKNFKFEWRINHLDLCVFDREANVLFEIQRGPA